MQISSKTAPEAEQFAIVRQLAEFCAAWRRDPARHLPVEPPPGTKVWDSPAGSVLYAPFCKCSSAAAIVSPCCEQCNLLHAIQWDNSTNDCCGL